MTDITGPSDRNATPPVLSRPDYDAFCDAVIGSREGYLCVALGHGPRLSTSGKYEHASWQELAYAWPSGREELWTDVSRELAVGAVDVYVCPALRRTGRRIKGNALDHVVAWVDADADISPSSVVWALVPLVVASGSAGHRQLYVRLSGGVLPGVGERLNQGLRDSCDGDHKWSSEALLRLPGTLNWKPAVLDPLSSPSPVTILDTGTRHPWSGDGVAAQLGVSLVSSAAGNGPNSEDATPAVVAGEALTSELPTWLTARLSDPAEPADRSAAFHGLVCACQDAGLTQGQALTVLQSWRWLPERYAGRLDAEVARVWPKAAPSPLGDGFGFLPLALSELVRAGAESDSAASRVSGVGPGTPQRFFDPKYGLLVSTLASEVIGAGPLAEGIDDQLWAYASGVWKPSPHIVRTRVAQLLGQRYRRSHGTNAEDVVRSTVSRIDCSPVPSVINFANGLLDWRTGELGPHTPSVPSTVQLPVPWDPSASCPEFSAWLGSVVPPDMVPVVWELIGYLMYSGNPLHKAVMLIGTGRNGKGTLLRVAGRLLGTHNVTSVSLHDLVNTRFSTVSLFGKIANIAGDIDGSYLESTATFKAITGQDLISAEHKGRDRFDFRPWAVPVFSANKIPPSSDATIGYVSRWLVVPFPHDFSGREDRGLDARLAAPSELAGIAATAVPALRTLMDRGDFELPPSGKAALDEFVRRVNQIYTWVDECADIHPDHPFLPRTTLYRAYKSWADRDGGKPVKAGEFYDRLDSVPGVSATRREQGTRGFVGIKIADNGDEWWN